jgi:integrase
MSTKISYYLKEPLSKEETLLLCFVYITRNHKFKLSTGIKLHPDFWNTDKQEVRKSHIHAEKLNQSIKKSKAEYEDLCLQASLQNLPITKDFIVRNSLKFKENQTDSLFFVAYDEFVKSKKVTCTFRTIEKYQLIKTYLKSFSTKKGYNLTFDTIDLVFHQKFTEYLLYDLGMFNNTVSKTVKFVKTFLNYAAERDYHENYKFKKFKELKDNSTEIIALSENELSTIENLQDLPNYLEKCKELFLILCYTGLRFSDLESINHTKINDNTISYVVTKTKEQQKIFVNNKIDKILSKYTIDNVLNLSLISNAKANKYLKEIGQRAELNEPIKKVRFKGGEAITTNLKKWELLTTHTGRRTFTTLSLFKGINPELVKKITGHKTDREFKRYQKFNDEQLMQSMKVWDK